MLILTSGELIWESEMRKLRKCHKVETEDMHNDLGHICDTPGTTLNQRTGLESQGFASECYIKGSSFVGLL